MSTRIKAFAFGLITLITCAIQAQVRVINPVLVPVIARRVVRITPLMQPVMYHVLPGYLQIYRPQVFRAGILLPQFGMNLRVAW